MHKKQTAFTLLMFTLLTACGGGGGGSSDPGSNNDGSNNTGGGAPTTQKGSHNAGQDCITCHTEQGTASNLIFNSSGTVYKSNGSPHTSATVNLYLMNTNTRVASMKTDASGNFYTTDFVEGLFYGGARSVSVDVEVKGITGTAMMSGTVTARSCNSCHGKSRGGIRAN